MLLNLLPSWIESKSEILTQHLGLSSTSEIIPHCDYMQPGLSRKVIFISLDSTQVYLKLEGGRQLDLALDLVHGIDIARLDEVLELLDLLAQLLNGDLLVFDGAHDLIIRN